jgi:prevent-host-death family protein
MADETRWRVTSDEARREFRALLDSVLQERAHVEITRYKTPVAVLVPIAWYQEAGGTLGDWHDDMDAETITDEGRQQ